MLSITARYRLWIDSTGCQLMEEPLMSFKQTVFDRIRVFNKHFTNKVFMRIAGSNIGIFVILRHVGRKSGKLYKIPIIAMPINNGFVIALTYGKKVDWYENVIAKRGCSIQWKNKEYILIDPKLIDKEIALNAFPKLFRIGLKFMKIQYFLRLEIQQ
jgi:deazaflavin-dependent oxidoreductase (nitroreductase family)